MKGTIQIEQPPMRMQATLSFAMDLSTATVQSDICSALTSIAADRREWPKLLPEHLIKILTLGILEEQASTKEERKR
jgi:hypothetical protein